jgi:hypothetical protein
MHKLVKRITVLKHGGGDTVAAPVYRASKGNRKVSGWDRPLERAARKLWRAQILSGEEGLRRQGKSNRRRRDGWLVDSPIILFEAGREAYNEARKALPFRILPKV